AISFVGLFGIDDQHPTLDNPLQVVVVLVLAFIVTMVVMGTLGVIIERFAYRPLRNAPRLAPLISAIGVSYILQNVGQVWKGPSTVNFPDIFEDTIIRLDVGDGELIIRSKAILIVVVSVSIMALLTQFVQRTKLGKAMRATAQDQSTSSLMGINV